MNNILADIDVIAFSIGSLQIRWYGLIITIGMILALVFGYLNIKRLGMHFDDAIEVFLWIVPLGVICARLLYVFVRPDEYFYKWTSFDDFVNMIAVWEGGLTIIGGIIGGIIGLIIFWFRHRNQLSLGQAIDVVIVPLLIAQALGRTGNFINQEAFGVAITNPAMQHFPIAIYITNPSGVSEAFRDEVWGYISANGGGYWFAATFFYEMMWNLLGAVIFYIVFLKNKKLPGILFFAYLAWECLIRGLLEFIRVDAVPITQVLCFTLLPILIIGGFVYAFYRISKTSYLKMKYATLAGTISGINISKFDAWNYAFVGRLLMPEKRISKFFKWLYSIEEHKFHEMELYINYVRL